MTRSSVHHVSSLFGKYLKRVEIMLPKLSENTFFPVYKSTEEQTGTKSSIWSRDRLPWKNKRQKGLSQQVECHCQVSY